ncbi:MAG TPA: uracil-DNA glycosylase family protein [Spirochaetota bacterium]|nr:uracil-DNA glycosylase family protein [Spirochaetota bacterium]HPJ41798.1 uracil-DNA glycosylase family protein [Spirochaetota bacterium]HPR38102.1 uracil-DNA glycosylase family protein [Spirochaetota bacterium]
MQINYNISKDLALILREYGSDAAILFKNREELDYLKDYLKGKTKIVPRTDAAVTPEALINNCTKCKDIVERKTAYGTGENGVMIILNAPRMANKAELRIHRTESAGLLKKMINAIGLELHECYVTNLIKCESSDPFVKPSDMLRNCLDILKQEIEMINPVLGIVLGEIIPLQGVIKSVNGVSWFNTEHTISLIKNPELKRPAWETLKVVRQRYTEIKNDG